MAEQVAFLGAILVQLNWDRVDAMDTMDKNRTFSSGFGTQLSCMDTMDIIDSSPSVSGTESGGSTPPPAAKSAPIYGVLHPGNFSQGCKMVQPWCNGRNKFLFYAVFVV